MRVPASSTYVAPSKQTVRDFLAVWIDTIKPEVAAQGARSVASRPVKK